MSYRKNRFAPLAVALGAIVAQPADADESKRPLELGAIQWHRNFDAATEIARKEKKALLVLFQEVPGCATCVGYGNEVLSHPLVVEAAETLFVPVAVYNNTKDDADAETLQSFSEPAWNNPVVRVMSPDREMLAPRVAGDYSVGGMASAMVVSLQKQRSNVPKWLRVLADEAISRRGEVLKAAFAMHCFWEGEKNLAQLPGIISTTPGFLGELEVVEVEYDPDIINYGFMVKRAKQFNCASKVFARSDEQLEAAKEKVGDAAVRSDEPIKPDKTPKYYLAQSPLRFVPMTGFQQALVNAALGDSKDPMELLSPRQLDLYGVIQKHPNAEWKNAIGRNDLRAAWTAAAELAEKLRASPPAESPATQPASPS